MGLIGNSLQTTSRDEINVLYVHVTTLSEKEKAYIKTNLVEISKGMSTNFTCDIIAAKLLKLIRPKDKTTKIGMTAEFFQTVLIRNLGFEQNHLFMNLEENSIKKGFDGLFLKDDVMWILESKATLTNKTHQGTIKKAYDGVSKIVGPKGTNDPWENAVSHATNSKNDRNLISDLESFSMAYMKNDFKDIAELNVILGSTVVKQIKNTTMSITEVEQYIKKHDAKEEIIIMLNIDEENLFINMLEEISYE